MKSITALHAFLPFAAALVLSGCGAYAKQKSPALTSAQAARHDPAEALARITRWRAWEPKQVPSHRVQFADIAMSAELESVSTPAVQCQKLATGGMLCQVQLDLGKDDEGEPKVFSCSALVDRTPLPFGVLFKRALAGRTIEQVPALELETVAQTASARLVVPSYLEEENNTVFGTTKIAVAYGPGYSLACEDNNAGASAAFRRISSRFFATASFTKPAASSVLRMAYKHRRGEAVRGFTVASILKDDDGYSELHSSFHLESDGKQWHVMDAHKVVERDAKGTIESMRTIHWLEGGAPIVLSAKPAEAGKLRLKLEAGEKSDSLELTPRAPLSTELWEAPSLLKVSSGAAPSHKYGFLSISSDGEPTISYSAITRAKSGVVLEEIDHGKRKKGGDDVVEKNEVSVDDRGFATKQVSADTIYERLFLSGELPFRATAKGARKTP